MYARALSGLAHAEPHPSPQEIAAVFRIPLSDLDVATPAHQPMEAKTAHTHVPERKHTPHELNVIGCTVDEAISQADKFLDDAFLSEHRTVRLIHGLGKRRLGGPGARR